MIYPNFSRLVIDPNPRLEAITNNKNSYHASALKTQLICEINKKEVLVDIPCNIVNDTAVEEKRRWDIFVRPYESRVEEIVSKVLSHKKKVFIIQIHSFYPVYNGDIRKVDIGVIHNDNVYAKEIIEVLKKETNLVIGDNQPWGMAAVDGGIMKPFMSNNDITVIAFDINNKHLNTAGGIKNIRNMLSIAFKQVLL